MSESTFPKYFLSIVNKKGAWHVRVDCENSYSVFEQGNSTCEPILAKYNQFDLKPETSWREVSETEFIETLKRA